MAGLFASNQQRDRLLDGLLSWLDANMQFFEPPQEEHLAEEEMKRLQEQPRKSFIELGGALRLAQRVPLLWRRDDVQRLARRWVEMAHRRNVLFDGRRRVGLFAYKVAAYAILRALDGEQEEARAALQAVLDRQFVGHVEMTAWSKADLKYYVEAAGLRHSFVSDARLVCESTLSLAPPLSYARNIDLYAITHLLFDLSDFCARDPAPALGAHYQAMRDYTALATALCVTERNWDLTAELLMNRIALGDSDDPLNREATRGICEAQQPAGFIPDLKWLAAPPPGDEARATFDMVYHCTVVCLFLLACEATIA